MFTSEMNNIDPSSHVIMTMMEQHNQRMYLAEQHCHDAEECAHHAKRVSAAAITIGDATFW